MRSKPYEIFSSKFPNTLEDILINYLSGHITINELIDTDLSKWEIDSIPINTHLSVFLDIKHGEIDKHKLISGYRRRINLIQQTNDSQSKQELKNTLENLDKATSHLDIETKFNALILFLVLEGIIPSHNIFSSSSPSGNDFNIQSRIDLKQKLITLYLNKQLLLSKYEKEIYEQVDIIAKKALTDELNKVKQNNITRIKSNLDYWKSSWLIPLSYIMIWYHNTQLAAVEDQVKTLSTQEIHNKTVELLNDYFPEGKVNSGPKIPVDLLPIINSFAQDLKISNDQITATETIYSQIPSITEHSNNTSEVETRNFSSSTASTLDALSTYEPSSGASSSSASSSSAPSSSASSSSAPSSSASADTRRQTPKDSKSPNIFRKKLNTTTPPTSSHLQKNLINNY